jgi:hypothetical protein
VPTKVGDDIVEGEPQCNFGRGAEECIPGAFIRTNDFPRIAADWSSSVLFATWQDYRNNQFDIQLSTSTDGGKTWHEAARPVNPSTNLDHYFPAVDLGASQHVAISYYRTERVPNENRMPLHTTGCQPIPVPDFCFLPGDPGVQQQMSNYYLAGGYDLHTPYRDRRVSPDFVPPDGNQTGFNGDYSGIVAFDNIAMPIWSDTRNVAQETFPAQDVVHDEDIFTDRLEIP